MKIVGLFPGQGSQAVGMGKEWFENSDTAKKIFNTADEILGFSLSKLCFEGPIEELTLTQNAQPALLTVSYINYLLSDINISAAAGHSLGEYTALVAGGILSFEDAVLLVNKRGKYMQNAVPVDAGAMIAVMGMDEEPLQDLINKNPNLLVEIANINSPGQIVLAGEKAAIGEFSTQLSSAGAKVIPLNVSAPFHCSMMKPAADQLALDLDKTTFNEPKITIYSNFTANKIASGNEAKTRLKEQVCGTVKWTKQMQNMIANEAVDTAVEFGPGGVLTKLLKRIDAKIARHEVYDSVSLGSVKSKLGL